MTRLYSLSLAATLTTFALSSAAPAAKEIKTTPITAENAHQVRPVQDVPKTVYRLIRGPNRGALILFDYKSPAELVDDITFKPIRPFLKDRTATDVAVSRDGKLVAWSEDRKKSYFVGPIDGGKPIEIEIGDHAGYASFSPDGKQIAIGYTFWEPRAEGVGHSEVRVFESATGKHIRTLEKTGPGAVHPVYSPDGTVLAVGNRNYETLLFDAATGKLLHKLEKRMIQEIAFSPDSKKLAAGYVDGTLILWDVATGKLLHEVPSTCKEVYSVDWNPKGDVLATSGHMGKVVLWDPKGLTKLKELDGQSWVIRVRFTADGSRLLTAGAGDNGARTDRKITVWGLEGGLDR